MTDTAREILQKNKENSDQKENRDISGENLDAEKTLQQTVGKRESNGSGRQSGIAPPAELIPVRAPSTAPPTNHLVAEVSRTVRAPTTAPPTDGLVGAVSYKTPAPPYNVPARNDLKNEPPRREYGEAQENLKIAKDIAGGDTNPLANHLTGVDVAKQELSESLQKVEGVEKDKKNTAAQENYQQKQEDLSITKEIGGGDTNPLTNHLSGIEDAKQASSEALSKLEESEK